MLKIHNKTSGAISAKRNGQGVFLLTDPNEYVSNFIIRSMQKYSVLPIVLTDYNLRNPNIRKDFLSNKFKEPLLQTILRPRLNNLSLIFPEALKALKDKKEVHATPIAGVLFLDWILKKGHKDLIKDVDTDLTLDEMGEIYAKAKNLPFFPISLERLIKLFLVFYGKTLTKDQTLKIASLQNQLVFLEKHDNPEYALSCIKEEKIKKVKKIINTIQNNNKKIQKLPSVNIFNKINEEIMLLESKIQNDSNRISRDNFIKIESIENSLTDEFIDNYIEAYA